MCMDEQIGQKSIKKKIITEQKRFPCVIARQTSSTNRLWDRTRWPGPPPSKSCCMLGRLLSITRIQQPTQSFTPTPACTDTTSLCSLCSKGERRDTHPTPLHLQPVPLVLVLSFLDQSPHTHTDRHTAGGLTDSQREVVSQQRPRRHTLISAQQNSWMCAQKKGSSEQTFFILKWMQNADSIATYSIGGR